MNELSTEQTAELERLQERYDDLDTLERIRLWDLQCKRGDRIDELISWAAKRRRALADLATPPEEFDARFTKAVNEMELPAGRFRIFCPGCGSIWIQRVGAARMSVWCRFCNHAADVQR